MIKGAVVIVSCSGDLQRNRCHFCQVYVCVCYMLRVCVSVCFELLFWASHRVSLSVVQVQHFVTIALVHSLLHP